MPLRAARKGSARVDRMPDNSHQKVNRIRECPRLRWRDGEACDPMRRHKRDARIQTSVHHRLAARHSLELHDSEGLAARNGWEDEHVGGVVVWDNISNLAKKDHPVLDMSNYRLSL